MGLQMEPVTEDLSLRKQNMFFVEMKSVNTLIEKFILIGWQTMTNLHQEHLQAGLTPCLLIISARLQELSPSVV